MANFFYLKMNEFIELNPKFIKTLYWISAIFTIIALVFLYFIYEQVSITWILIILMLTLLFIPLFLLIVAYSDWKKNRTIRNKILAKKPFSEMKRMGFNKNTLVFSHLEYLDCTIYGEVNELQIIFFVENNNKNIAIFRIFGILKYDSFTEIHRKNKELQHLSINLSYDNIEKRIDLKDNSVGSVTELENTLKEFTHIAKMIIIEPIPKEEFNLGIKASR